MTGFELVNLGVDDQYSGLKSDQFLKCRADDQYWAKG